MEIITYPLNNVDYTAEDAELYNCTRTSGVYAVSDNLDISVSGDREVTIGVGIAWVKNSRFSGKVIGVKAAQALAVEVSDASLGRIDTVVLAFDAAANASKIYIKKGAPASTPARAALTKDESLYELGLYDIAVAAGSTSVSSVDITDTREESERCGIMGSGLTDLDRLATMEYVDQTMGDIASAISAVTASLSAL